MGELSSRVAAARREALGAAEKWLQRFGPTEGEARPDVAAAVAGIAHAKALLGDPDGPYWTHLREAMDALEREQAKTDPPADGRLRCGPCCAHCCEALPPAPVRYGRWRFCAKVCVDRFRGLAVVGAS